jgi:predicted nucleic acid-binding protein
VYLVDTDSLSRYFRFPDTYPTLRERLEQTDNHLLWISAVTVEEMLQGALAEVKKGQSRQGGMEAYSRLVQLLRFLNAWQILEFDEIANRLFQAFPASIKRIGANDCRIAASALHHNFTVVTCNLSHYSRVPGIVCEDWTLRPPVDE